MFTISLLILPTLTVHALPVLHLSQNYISLNILREHLLENWFYTAHLYDQRRQ